MSPPVSDNVTGRVVAVAAVAGAVVVAGVMVSRRLRAPQDPPADSAFRQVGHLSELHMFPLKSGKPVTVDKFTIGESGPVVGLLKDRGFVVVDRSGRFVSGRTHPGLLLVSVTLVPRPGGRGPDDALFELSCVKMDKTVLLDPAVLKDATHRKITVWGASVSAVDCGDEAAAWIRKAVVDLALHGEASASADLRLAFYPLERSDRGRMKEGGALWPLAPPGANGIYSDDFAYHIVTATSVAALNDKLLPADQVTAINFRPNFVVDGTAAFEEDSWKWVRIGGAVFRVIMPCGRCILTTVDPETGIKSTEAEPLATLRKFRKPDAAQKKAMRNSDAPMMGLKLGVVKYGKVNLGDPVCVAP